MVEKVVLLEGLDCANCAAKIERAAARVRGVDDASVAFMTRNYTWKLKKISLIKRCRKWKKRFGVWIPTSHGK